MKDNYKGNVIIRGFEYSFDTWESGKALIETCILAEEAERIAIEELKKDRNHKQEAPTVVLPV